MSAVLDLHHLDVIGGHRDPELREIIDDFVAELALHLSQAQVLVADGMAKEEGEGEGDAPELRDIAHKIRGMAGSLGFHPLAAVGTERDQDHPAAPAAEWLERLRTEITRATRAWEELKAS